MATNITNEAVNESFNQLLHISGGPEATEKIVYSGTGVATAFKLGTISASIANISFSGNTIEATSGNLTLGANIAFANASNARVALGLGSIATRNEDEFLTTAILATVATTGAYSDLSGQPTLAAVATTGAYSDLSGRPTLATVATTGAYSDLSGRPTLATVATTGAYSDLSERPTLATVATTGAYSDLSGRPALSSVAVTGSYLDLTDKITFAFVATSGSYFDLTETPQLGSISAQNADNINVTGGSARLDTFGYTTTSYDTETQLTSKSTPVTLNSITGRITMHNAPLSNNANVNFVLNNNQIASNDLLVVNVAGGGTPGVYVASVCCISEGSAVIKLQNISGGSLSEAVQILFAVIKIG